ncbi:MAG: hypothetical protein ACTSU5_10950 [Promethearchaeota archaeon]
MNIVIRRPAETKFDVEGLEQRLTAKITCPKCSSPAIVYAESESILNEDRDSDWEKLRARVGSQVPIAIVDVVEELSPTLKMKDYRADLDCPNCGCPLEVKFIVQKDSETNAWYSSVVEVRIAT